MIELEDGQGIIHGGKSIGPDSQSVPGPLNRGGDEKCCNPAINCSEKNSLVGLRAGPRGIAPLLQPGQMGEWVEIGADMLGAGRLTVVTLCHGNPPLAHLP